MKWPKSEEKLKFVGRLFSGGGATASPQLDNRSYATASQGMKKIAYKYGPYTK